MSMTVQSPAGTGDDWGRVPPQDLAAEQSVLGAMLISKEAITEVSAILFPGDFYRPAHETIFTAVRDLDARLEPVDAVTVAAELERMGELNRVGGAYYLTELIGNVPIAAHAEHYAKIVREKAILRRLVGAGTKIVQLGQAGEGQVDDIVDAAQAEIYRVTEHRTSEDFAPLGDIVDDVLAEIETIQNRDKGLYGVPTGFSDLDRLTNGFRGGQMVIVAARPGMGKSTLALDFCRAASIKNGVTSVFFSLEMTRSEITMRLFSAEAGVPLNKLRRGDMNDEDWRKLTRHMGRVAESPLFIDDSPNMSITEIRSKARRLKQRHGLGLVVIDYIQLMTSGRKVESRQVEVSEFSRQIKLLAKELDIPVIALSQLNRSAEEGKDKKPQLSHLRESGALEQDADMVILIHREDKYDPNSRPGEADLIVAKHRNGPTDDIAVAFRGEYSQFADMARGF